ncbi:MAG: FHA domain-containing protein [Kofleriaceae bacterium]|nr:FHA domain-containing protein [Myxococcales bacterium]MCB9560039.1 FHA domain-containing protein [Kofleriaceae bacterium]MCB9571910.1 FHA domain-containing protein [Kofleriaceae bacterium]
MPNDDDPGTSRTQQLALRDLAPETVRAPQAFAARLVCLVGREVGRVYRLGAGTSLIGRSLQADVCVDEPDVSREHAQVTFRAGRHVVRDLGSENGTQVNGSPVTEHVLRPGDRIQIAGSAVLVYGRPDDLDERAQRLQKLEMMSQLAGELVHDFKNVLTVIKANVEFAHGRALGAVTRDPELLDALDDIQQALTSSQAMTQRLLGFTRRSSPHAAAVADVARVVDEVVALVRRSLPVNIRVQVDVAPQLRVTGSDDDLRQVLLNLCLNARDAMPDGGTLSIHGGAGTLERVEALSLHLPGPGTYADLAVTDTGVGMTEQVRARLFEPFFTTKPPDRGSGLGLATVYGLVRSLGGNVFAESSPGRGATFRVLLPVASDLPDTDDADRH